MLYQQPQLAPFSIDQTNTFGSRLKFAFLPSSVKTNPATVSPITLVGTYGTGVNTAGKSITFDGSSYYTCLGTAGLISNNSVPHTVFTMFVPTTLTGQVISTIGEVADTNYGSNIAVETTGTIGWHNGGSGFTPLFVSTNTVNLNVVNTAASVVRGASDRSVFLNGVKTSSSASFQGACNGTVAIGEYFVNATAQNKKFVGGINLVLMFDYAMTDAEIASITANPWQVFLDSSEDYIPQTSSATIITANGSSVGSSTVYATSNTIFQSTGSSIGVSTVTAIANSIAQSIGSSIGLGTASASAISIIQASGASNGTSTSNAVANAIASAVGASVGTSVAQATGNVIFVSSGSANGTSTASAMTTASTIITTIGSASGTSVAQAISATIAQSQGQSSGTSLASGITQVIFSSVGNSYSSSNANAVANAIVQAVGNAAGTSTANAITSGGIIIIDPGERLVATYIPEKYFATILDTKFTAKLYGG